MTVNDLTLGLSFSPYIPSNLAVPIASDIQLIDAIVVEVRQDGGMLEA